MTRENEKNLVTQEILKDTKVKLDEEKKMLSLCLLVAQSTWKKKLLDSTSVISQTDDSAWIRCLWRGLRI